MQGEMNWRSHALGFGFGLGIGYLLWKSSSTSDASKCPPKITCPPCDPNQVAKACKDGSLDAALTISDFRKKNSTWVPYLLPQILAKMNLLSVPAREDHFDPKATSDYRNSYNDCFASSLEAVGLGVDENGKVSTL